MTEENNNKLEKLAADVLRLSRNQLLVNLRFLDAALSRLEPRPVPEITFATDGQYLAYGPKHILRCYKTDRRIPVRDCLHIIFHCIYRHMFVHTLVDHVAWDLACDIAVEACITGLGLQAAECARQAEQSEVCEMLKKEIGQLTAEKIYRYYLDRKLTPVQMADLRGLFYADDHVLWYLSEEEKNRRCSDGSGRCGSMLYPRSQPGAHRLPAGPWRLVSGGNGCSPGRKKGFQLSLKAAIQGDNQAMFNVGMCYQLGRGVGYSLKRALDWYEASQAAYPKPELARRVQLLKAMPDLEKEESKTGLPPGHRDALTAAWKTIREKSLTRAGLSNREVLTEVLFSSFLWS